VAVSIKSFREPDLWWQIRTGQWILQHHGVPHQDVFSYTMAGVEWINIKWGFEVLAAMVSNLSGPESIFILQAIVNCLLVFFLLKLSITFIQKPVANYIPERLPPSGGGGAFIFSAAISFIIFFIGTDYRMIGRPEMVSHLMTVVFLFILEKYRQSPSKQIYFLIPLQMLWANLHEAYGIGLVILVIYTVSAIIQRPSNIKIVAEGRKNLLPKLFYITVACTAAVVVNPNGIKLLTRPLNIMSQVYENKYTTELLSFTSYNWWKKEAWIALTLFIISISALFFIKLPDSKDGWQRRILKKLANGYTLVVLAFLCLGMAAYRNLIFLSLVCFPVFHSALFNIFKKWLDGNKSTFSDHELRHSNRSKYLFLASIGSLLSFYVLIVSNKYYEFTKSRDRFGLEVLSNFNPVGASEFIEKNHLKGKKCFSDYLTSSYLLWKLQPDFKTFIDLRDLDIFPKEHFEKFFNAANFPGGFYRLDSAEHFDYAVLYQSQFMPLHAYLYNDSIYALKYVDAVAAVYQKTDSFTKEDIFSNCKPVEPGLFARAINKILNPLYHSFDYSTIDSDYIAASYYINTNRLELALKRAQGISTGGRAYEGYELMGQIYHRYSRFDKSEEKSKSYQDSSEQYFTKSLLLKKDYSPSLLGLATIFFEKENYFGALKNAGKCLSVDDRYTEAHIISAESYKAMLSRNVNSANQNKYLNQMLDHYLVANSLNPGNPGIEANIGFCYFRLSNCSKAKDYLIPVKGNRNLSDQERSAIHDCLKQCGI